MQCYWLLQGWKFFKFRSSIRLSCKICQVTKCPYLPAQCFSGNLKISSSLEKKSATNMQHSQEIETYKNHLLLITLLSPVTTIRRMPAVMQESIALFTSSLGGSSIPTYILKTRILRYQLKRRSETANLCKYTETKKIHQNATKTTRAKIVSVNSANTFRLCKNLQEIYKICITLMRKCIINQD